MKFGALPQDRLAGIDLSLPKEPESNALVLPGTRAANPNFILVLPSGVIAVGQEKFIHPKHRLHNSGSCIHAIFQQLN
jgi:hypothetical protein